MKCVDEGVVMHTQGRKCLAVQVYDPVTQLVVTSGDEATLFEIQGMGDG